MSAWTVDGKRCHVTFLVHGRVDGAPEVRQCVLGAHPHGTAHLLECWRGHQHSHPETLPAME